MNSRARIYFLLGLSLGAILLAWLLPVIHQDPEYHIFAAGKSWLGIPHFWNVTTNACFAAAGLYGCLVLGRRGWKAFRAEDRAYLTAFAGCFLVAAGSAWYHWQPDNTTLFWDRLPMTIVFMALLAAVIAERIHSRLGAGLLLPFIFLGVWSVEIWRRGELTGLGDLRFYAIVQFYPILILPLILWLFPARYTGEKAWWGIFGSYGVAKLFESADIFLFRWSGGALSGHPLKHVFAALSICLLARMLARRRPCSP